MGAPSGSAETLAADIARGELDAVEERWLTRLAEDPEDVPFFSGVASALIEAGAEEQASFLLQMLDEQLREEGRWLARLELLRHRGALLTGDGAALHREIVSTLEAAHPGHSALHALAEKLGLFRGVDDLPKIWGKVERLLELARFDRGSIVWLEGKGPARVAEVNLQLGSFRVELSSGGSVGVGFAAAAKVLRPLPPGHVRRRALEEPETLRRLAKEDPSELVRLALESESRPLTAGELREGLEGIVPEKEWTSFWNRARKHPQLLVMPGPRQRYRWAESAEDAVATLERRFEEASLDDRLELLRRHGDRDAVLRSSMIEQLLILARGGSPGEAFRIALALEQSGATGDQDAIDPQALLTSLDDPLGFLASLSDRGAREEALRRFPAVRDDWPDLFARAMTREAEPRLLDHLAGELRRVAPEKLGAVVGDFLAHPSRSAAGFTWLAERAAEDESLLGRAPLRLFQQILRGASDSAFAPFRRRLLALAESGGTLPRLLHLLEPDQAPLAEEALDRAAGLADYQRIPLRNALHLRFPELRQADEAPLYASPEAIAAKRQELQTLLEEEIPANRRAIEAAREMGDLRENFEYKSARQRHEYLSARATALHRDLARARPVEPTAVDSSAVRVGTRVRLEGDNGVRIFTILGPWDSKPEEGVLSNEAALAQKLLGLELGDALELEGESLRVVAIEPYR
jgi:transcription elongation GreA/GreB family factor